MGRPSGGRECHAFFIPSSSSSPPPSSQLFSPQLFPYFCSCLFALRREGRLFVGFTFSPPSPIHSIGGTVPSLPSCPLLPLSLPLVAPEGKDSRWGGGRAQRGFGWICLLLVLEGKCKLQPKQKPSEWPAAMTMF
jgi:hypothetical protein